MEAVIIIIAPAPCSLDELRRAIPADFDVADASGGRLVVWRAGRHVYLGAEDRVIDDYETEDGLDILASVPNAVFFVLEYSDISLCKALLAAIADRPDVLVDNDHGCRLPGADFVRRMRNEPPWDWLRERLMDAS